MNYSEGRIHSLNAQVAASVVRVEAMKVKNSERERKGLAQAWDGEAFHTEAAYLSSLATEIQLLSQQL